MPSESFSDTFVRTVPLPKPEKGQQRQVAYTEKIETGLGLMLIVS
jgi:hypothetical protein